MGKETERPRKRRRGEERTKKKETRKKGTKSQSLRDKEYNWANQGTKSAGDIHDTQTSLNAAHGRKETEEEDERKQEEWEEHLERKIQKLMPSG